MDTGRIIALIGDIHAGANRFLVGMLKRRGLKGLVPSHGAILHHLFRHDAVTMKELAAAARRDKSTVTALVKKLAAAGYVETIQCPVDQRSVRVRLTPEGRALEPIFQDVSQRLLAKVWAGVSPGEQQDVMRILQKIDANFL